MTLLLVNTFINKHFKRFFCRKCITYLIQQPVFPFKKYIDASNLHTLAAHTKWRHIRIDLITLLLSDLLPNLLKYLSACVKYTQFEPYVYVLLVCGKILKFCGAAYMK